VLNYLGALLVVLGKPADAEPLFTETLAFFKHNGVPDSDWKVGVTLEGRGRALTALGRFAEAEHDLLTAQRVIAAASQARPQHARSGILALVALYDAWDKSEPYQGHQLKAREWRGKLPTTAPATTQAAVE